MVIKKLTDLKINKLTKEQYERELAAGRIDGDALYLTPDEEDGEGGDAKNVWYGTCGTEANVEAKVVTTTTGDFRLETGNILYVRFDNPQGTSKARLVVDGLDEVLVVRSAADNLSHIAVGTWCKNDTVGFVVAEDGRFEMLEPRVATTWYYGVVKLTDSVTSVSTTTAATPNAVKQAYNLADTANAESVKTVAQELTAEQKTQVLSNLGLSSEVWTFEMEDGTTVEKKVVLT